MVKILLFGGHGPGNKWNRGFKTVNGRKNNEGDNNIRIEKKLKNYLIKNYQGVKVDAYMSDNNIKYHYSNYERSRKGKGYDLFLSIHSNASIGGTGPEIYTQFKNVNNKKVLDFVKDMNKSVATTLGLYNRGLKWFEYNRGYNVGTPKTWYTDGFEELRGNQAKVAVLLEMFFHDNTNDIKAFYKNEDRMIKALGDTIADYYKLKKKGATSTNTSKTKPYLARVTSTKLNVRRGPGMNYKITGFLSKGDVYTIIDISKSGNWGKLKYNLGWIGLKHTEPVNDSTVSKGDKVKITGRRYYTGQEIPQWVRSGTFTVKEVSKDNVLIKEINSRVKIEDIRKV